MAGRGLVSFDFWIGTTMCRGLLFIICLALSGCRPDPQQVADKLVDEEFLSGRQKAAGPVDCSDLNCR